MHSNRNIILPFCVLGAILCLLALASCKNQGPGIVIDGNNNSVLAEAAASARVPTPDEYHEAYILDYTSEGMRCLYVIGKHNGYVSTSCISIIPTETK